MFFFLYKTPVSTDCWVSILKASGELGLENPSRYKVKGNKKYFADSIILSQKKKKKPSE